MGKRSAKSKIPLDLDLAPNGGNPTKRDKNGRLLPGSVLNPGGKSANYFEIIRLARAYAPEALETLIGIMRSAERDSDRLAAANAVLDRGLGKAPQTVEINVDGPAKDMTDQALRLAAQEILARLPEGATVQVDGEQKEAHAVDVEILPPAPRYPSSSSD